MSDIVTTGEAAKPPPPSKKATTPASTQHRSELSIDDYQTKGIPVALVEWDRMWKPPGKSAEQTLRTYEGNDGRGWKVEFLPSLRMMRVTHTDKTRPERGGVRLVPIERVVSWEAG